MTTTTLDTILFAEKMNLQVNDHGTFIQVRKEGGQWKIVRTIEEVKAYLAA